MPLGRTHSRFAILPTPPSLIEPLLRPPPRPAQSSHGGRAASAYHREGQDRFTEGVRLQVQGGNSKPWLLPASPGCCPPAWGNWGRGCISCLPACLQLEQGMHLLPACNWGRGCISCLPACLQLGQGMHLLPACLQLGQGMHLLPACLPATGAGDASPACLPATGAWDASPARLPACNWGRGCISCPPSHAHIRVRARCTRVGGELIQATHKPASTCQGSWPQSAAAAATPPRCAAGVGHGPTHTRLVRPLTIT